MSARNDLSRSIKLLFMGAAKKVSLAERFLDSARRLGVGLALHSYELDDLVPIASVAEVVRGLKWQDPAIVDDLARVMAHRSIDILIPNMDPAILVAAKLKERIPDAFVPVSSYDRCLTFFDKQKAHEWFVNNGINVPEATAATPFIAKPKQGSASQGIFVIETGEEKERFFGEHNPADYLIQRFVRGEEYTVDCYVSSRGRILSVVPRVRLEVTAGEVTRTRSARDERIIEVSRTILEKAQLIGPVNIQCIRESGTGEIFAVEINPRFGGGVLCSIEAGADFPEMLLRDYYGEDVEPVEFWRDGLLMTRCYREYFYSCK